MAGVGQQGLVAAHQGLDAAGRQVEGGGHGGHLVAAAVVHPLRQVATAKGLYALLERLQPACQPAHHRVSAGGHRHKQQRHQDQRAHRLRQAEGPVGLAGQKRHRWRAHAGAARPLTQRRAGGVVAQHRTTRLAQAERPAGATPPGQQFVGRRAFGCRAAQQPARQPQRAAVVQPHRGGLRHTVPRTPQKAVGRADAHTAPVVQRQRHA